KFFSDFRANAGPLNPFVIQKLTPFLGPSLPPHPTGRGILKSAYEHTVPVSAPAFTDSEIGLDFALTNRRRRLAGKAPLAYDPFLDLEHYTESVQTQKLLGIFTIGGGVPRNWGQQVGPYLELINKRVGQRGGFRRFPYRLPPSPPP